MANLRIIYDNAIDRATLSASSTAGSLAVSNLLTDIKSAVWRATGISATLTATWSAAEIVSGVVLPFTNLTPAATIRVRGYTNIADATPAFDTGTIAACAATTIGPWGWASGTVGANSFAYGGGAYARAWIGAPAAVKKITIDLVDAANPAGYVEAGRLVAGAYWSPVWNFDYGTSVTMVDSSKQQRSDAGDLLTDIGTRHRKQNLSLSTMPEADRAALWDIARGNGLARPMLISGYPNDASPHLEQTHQIYCKLTSMPSLAAPYFAYFSGQLEIEEV